MQLRPAKGKKWNPNSTVLAVIETVDQSTFLPVTVGTATIPMYLIAGGGPNRGNMVTSEKEKQVALHAGHFQLQVHHALPKLEQPFSSARVVFKERVPTCSLLLRIVKAGKNNDTGEVINEPKGMSEDEAIA